MTSHHTQITSHHVPSLPDVGAAAERPRFEQTLTALVVEAYERGWQPAELLRQARRDATRGAQTLAQSAIAADHRARPE